jgi:hypothetical protein
MNIYVIIAIPLALAAAIAIVIYLVKSHADPGRVEPDPDLRRPRGTR